MLVAESSETACKVAWCNARMDSFGYCRDHYRRSIKGLDMDKPLRIRRPTEVVALRDEYGNKHCPTCDRWLPEACFYKHRGSNGGLSKQCRECIRAKKYNMSASDIHKLMSEQDSLCAICGQNIAGQYCIDHDHACCAGDSSCGRCVRGLLCNSCNTAVGFFRDSAEVCLSAAKYLEIWEK